MLQKLQQWQTKNKVSDAALAKKVGVHQTAISRAKRGLRILGMEHQLKVQEITDNEVLPVDWAQFYALTTHLRPKKSSEGAGKKAAKRPFAVSVEPV